jgi:hypothetical protein
MIAGGSCRSTRSSSGACHPQRSLSGPSIHTDEPPCFMPNPHEERPWSRPFGESRQWFMPVTAACERPVPRIEKRSCLSSSQLSAIQVGASLQRNGLTTRTADGWTRGDLPRRISFSAFPPGRRSSLQPRLTQTVGRFKPSRQYCDILALKALNAL